MAVADVQCKSQEKLVEALFEAEARLQEQAIKRHGAYFSKLSAAQVKYLGRVNEVIKVKGAP
ncbi:hypothetical protein CP970_43965 [Streptomyces kanamyceticus]|uniref:Uncharacterized protein n=1 Tax=Streptomyces kanamyceticus TaxID=1967 RepID=A0A5J6GM11_STRKN|nr:hypothetical protein CP970_43965 [Streptomyces kanamyceticus]